MLEECGVNKLFVVSSPVHMARCSRDWWAAIERKGSKICLYITCSQTYWGESLLKNLVIIEPPSRPDDTTSATRIKIAQILFDPEKLQKVKEALGL